MTEQFSPYEFNPNHERPVTAGRVLYLTTDPERIRYQLDGGKLTNVSESDLMDKVSTDEIIPNRACLTWTGYEEGHLGKYLLTGLRGGVVKPGEIVAGNFNTVVAGPSFARGSSRIHAPLAFADAGINLIIADAERIFAENCVNLRIHLLSTKVAQAQKLLSGQSVPEDELLSILSPQAQEIMRSGSLLSYLDAVEKGTISVPEIRTGKRPMTAVEKIVAGKTLNPDGSIGVVAVKPEDEVVAIPDVYYGYELQTNATVKALRGQFGDDIKTRMREKVFLYNDHTALLKDAATATLRGEQTKFAKPQGIKVYEIDAQHGAPAICHTDMVEHHAVPGELVLGNDSHTCTVGVLNTLAIGKGALDLAGAIAFDKMVITVPQTIRINFSGQLPKGVTMKDFMLHLGAMHEFKNENIASGKILEFGGHALSKIPINEQLKLTNMAVELQAFSGIIEPNEELRLFLSENRATAGQLEELFVSSDPDAEYFATFNIDLSTIEATIATPGDTQNGKPLSEIREQQIRIDKAYIGSCTHGTVEDLRQAAEVLSGRKVADGVKLYVQASSLGNQMAAETSGYLSTLIDAGAELLPIGCGACMNAGPGSTEVGEIGIFATNRNFPGRTGRGETYLSNPAVVAASAIKGVICGPEDLD